MVLPFVPVTPNVMRCSPGLPYTQAATGPSTARGSAATSTGTGAPSRSSGAAATRAAPSASVSTARAPRATASAANRAPCACAPGSATKRSPSATTRLSEATEVTVTGSAGDDGTSTVSSPKVRARSRTFRGGVPTGRMRSYGDVTQ